jgi:hypothetical protein
MSKLPLLLIVLVTLVGEFLAQPPIAEWNEVKSIELLKSNRSEVGALLKKESLESVLSGYSEYFYTPNSVIRVRYSKGTCNGDTEDWNVPQGIVTEVEITLKDDIQISKIGIDLSKYRKERTDWQRKNIYVLTDKPTGIAVSVFASRVDSIYLFPSAKNYQRLCDKPALKEYYARKRWLRDPKSKKMIIDYNSPANVVDVGIEQTKQDEKHFSIFTKAEDPRMMY